MLRRLLELVASNGTARTAELASALGVSTALIESMLEELARRGYLRLLPGSAQPCERCPLRSGCLYSKRARIWIVSNIK
jgi:DeoR/GlpR family transcriptional regulator of sugar metabolism